VFSCEPSGSISEPARQTIMADFVTDMLRRKSNHDLNVEAGTCLTMRAFP